MAYLGNPSNTIAVLKKHDIHIQKKYGQNFLVNSYILNKIIKAAEVTKEDCVLEIGPGIGTMTQYLAESAGRVVAVEIDGALLPVLDDTLSDYENVTVIHQDILKADIEALIRERCGGMPVKVVANLPYYITTPVVMKLLESRAPLSGITVMVQKEVADRMQAGPGTKDYGALSLAVQYYADADVMFSVSPNCFLPKPNVESAVIRLVTCEKHRISLREETFLFAVIRAAFGQRRKTLVNSLVNAPNLQMTKEEVVDALEEMKLNHSIRGEALTLEQFIKLSRFFVGL